MRSNTVSNSYRLYSITVTTTGTVLRSLQAPPSGSILQVALTPASDISIADKFNEVWATLAGGTTKVFPVTQAFDILKLKCASGTVAAVLEVYSDTTDGSQ